MGWAGWGVGQQASGEAAWRGPLPACLVRAGLCDLAVGVPGCPLGPGQSQHPGHGLRRHQTGCWGQQQVPLALLQGIQFLIENDLLKNTCEDIAQFLYKGEGLNKTAIGDYLGERYAGLGQLASPEDAWALTASEMGHCSSLSLRGS